MTTLNNEQLKQVELLYKHYKKTDLTRSEINDFIKIGNIKNPSWLKQDQFKVSRGVYALPIDGDISPKVKEDIIAELPKTETAPVNETVNQAAFIVSSLTGNIVPDTDPVFVPWVTSKILNPLFLVNNFILSLLLVFLVMVRQ